MSASISAAENLANDFGWLPGLLAWLSAIVAGFGPVLALWGAIHLYYRRQETDREEARRVERRESYSGVLSQCNVLWNELTEGPHSKKSGTELVRLGADINLLHLVAPRSIYLNALKLKIAYGSFGKFSNEIGAAEWDDQIGVEKSEINRHLGIIRNHEKSLVGSMRKDLGIE